ncbi:MAG: homoserine kinase [Myxococcales bacterium]|nr:homoserine kinase [Myxococcales bacterium]
MSNDTLERVRVFAPATVGNVGPGYDVLGLAIDGVGDIVHAHRIDEPGAARLLRIEGADMQPADDNTAVVGARGALALCKADFGVELVLEKGLPIGSGLGSSGASAAAAAMAVNLLAGSPLPPDAFVGVCAEAERVASGAPHADNVAPALLGGVVLLTPHGRPIRIHSELELGVALVTPAQRVETRYARETIPASIPLVEAISNNAMLATLVYALATNNAELLRGTITDRIAEPRRAPLIKGFAEAKQAALDAGALGASISGSGPTIFALCNDVAKADAVQKAMSEALHEINIAHVHRASPVAKRGAHAIDDDGKPLHQPEASA